MSSFFFFSYGLISICLIIGILKQKRKEINTSNTNKFIETTDSEIAIIIPFRNEIERIELFISSLNELENAPEEILFIDDHSTDFTSTFIKNNLKLKHTIITLPEELKGKKAAIREGVARVEKAKYILTLDADIHFNKTYFENLKKLPKTDLTILPVKMQGKTSVQALAATDYNLLSIFNCSISGWKRPILASGANLLFKKETFLNVDSYINHQHIASGDDMFLLKDFYTNNKSIQLITSDLLTVITDSPSTLKEILHQRLRWIGKNKSVNDQLSNNLALLNISFLIYFYLVVGYHFYSHEYLLGIVTIGLKLFIDCLIIFLYDPKTKFTDYIYFTIYSFIQPIYYVTLAVLLPFKKAQWKNRTI